MSGEEPSTYPPSGPRGLPQRLLLSGNAPPNWRSIHHNRTPVPLSSGQTDDDGVSNNPTYRYDGTLGAHADDKGPKLVRTIISSVASIAYSIASITSISAIAYSIASIRVRSIAPIISSIGIWISSIP